MYMDSYQYRTRKTAVYPNPYGGTPALYPALKISGEAGEVTEQIGKAIRDDAGNVTPERREAIRKELGDVLWYIARIADDLDMDLSSIARRNLEKLQLRQARGTLQGSGDDR